ncbi:MAG: hypothetical protein RLZZ440_617 [Planctomycetota bacterium]|jgi:hypothetical protein
MKQRRPAGVRLAAQNLQKQQQVSTPDHSPLVDGLIPPAARRGLERGMHTWHPDNGQECRSQLELRPETVGPDVPGLSRFATGRTPRSIGQAIVLRGGARLFACLSASTSASTGFANGTFGRTAISHVARDIATRTAGGNGGRAIRCGSCADPTGAPVGPGQHREHHRVKDQMAEAHHLLPERNPGRQKILLAAQAGKPTPRRPLDRALRHVRLAAGKVLRQKPLPSARHWGIWARPTPTELGGVRSRSMAPIRGHREQARRSIDPL